MDITSQIKEKNEKIIVYILLIIFFKKKSEKINIEKGPDGDNEKIEEEICLSESNEKIDISSKEKNNKINPENIGI